jgi:threonine synthase
VARVSVPAGLDSVAVATGPDRQVRRPAPPGKYLRYNRGMRHAELVCTGCGAVYALDSLTQRCTVCNEPVEVRGDVRGARPRASGTLLERYQEFLAFSGVDPRLSLGEGNTPLIRARQLEAILKVGSLMLKIEGQNPSGSFKDRGTVAGVTWCVSRGVRRVGTVSTGNMGGSVAAYAARAGLPCTVVTSPDIPTQKLGPIGIHRPGLLRLTDGYGDAYDTSLRLRHATGAYFINSDDPFRIEGQKTLALELLEQSAGRPPDVVVVPVSSGGNACALLKGFREWSEAGLSDPLPRLLCVQSTGCAPIAAAFDRDEARPVEVGQPCTIAHAISNPNPPSGARLLRELRNGDRGLALSVSDREIEAAQLLLAEEEGVFVQPDAAASLAGLTSAVRRGLVGADERVALILTGHGLKDPSVFERVEIDVRITSSSGLARALSQ